MKAPFWVSDHALFGKRALQIGEHAFEHGYGNYHERVDDGVKSSMVIGMEIDVCAGRKHSDTVVGDAKIRWSQAKSIESKFEALLVIGGSITEKVLSVSCSQVIP